MGDVGISAVSAMILRGLHPLRAWIGTLLASSGTVTLIVPAVPGCGVSLCGDVSVDVKPCGEVAGEWIPDLSRGDEICAVSKYQIITNSNDYNLPLYRYHSQTEGVTFRVRNKSDNEPIERLEYKTQTVTSSKRLKWTKWKY